MYIETRCNGQHPRILRRRQDTLRSRVLSLSKLRLVFILLHLFVAVNAVGNPHFDNQDDYLSADASTPDGMSVGAPEVGLMRSRTSELLRRESSKEEHGQPQAAFAPEDFASNSSQGASLTESHLGRQLIIGEQVAFWSPIVKHYIAMDPEQNGIRSPGGVPSGAFPSGWTWEVFRVTRVGDYGNIALYSPQHKRFLRMTSSGMAGSKIIRRNGAYLPRELEEHFKPVYKGDKVALFCKAHNRFIKLWTSSHLQRSPIRRDGTIPSSWGAEWFNIVDVCVNTRDNKAGAHKCGNMLRWGASCKNYLSWKDCDLQCGLCACSSALHIKSQHCSGHGTCKAKCGRTSCSNARCECYDGWMGARCNEPKAINTLEIAGHICDPKPGGKTCHSYLNSKDCDMSCDLWGCSTASGKNPEHCSGHGTCSARCTDFSCTGASCECEGGYRGKKCDVAPTLEPTPAPTPGIFHLVPPGSIGCDRGFNPPEADCLQAVRYLARKHQRTMGRNHVIGGSGGECLQKGWGSIPGGCSVQTGGDWSAHFKHDFTAAHCLDPSYQLVCFGEKLCVNSRDGQTPGNKCTKRLQTASCTDYLRWKGCDNKCGLCPCSSNYHATNEHCSGHGTCLANCGRTTCTNARCKCQAGWYGARCSLFAPTQAPTPTPPPTLRYSPPAGCICKDAMNNGLQYPNHCGLYGTNKQHCIVESKSCDPSTRRSRRLDNGDYEVLCTPDERRRRSPPYIGEGVRRRYDHSKILPCRDGFGFKAHSMCELKNEKNCLVAGGAPKPCWECPKEFRCNDDFKCECFAATASPCSSSSCGSEAWCNAKTGGKKKRCRLCTQGSTCAAGECKCA